MRQEHVDILIIGAGPSGAVAAGLLRKHGRSVLVLEKELFPRFSIGESLLPQCMEFIAEAGMLSAVVEAGFQLKNGAAFCHRERYVDFDFREKFSPGWGTTYQVRRAEFDHLLAHEAARAGADIRYRHEVIAVDVNGPQPHVVVRDGGGSAYGVQAGFILDASGFGRTLPRLLALDLPSKFPSREALFTHIQDHVSSADFDREKIRITIHPQQDEVWFWNIPFADGRSSVGVVAPADVLANYLGSNDQRLRALFAEDHGLNKMLGKAVWDTPARSIKGYAATVKTLCGPGYALLGNAGEFLDPIFSSGVTIALKSASLAVACLERERLGESLDWHRHYARPLQLGVDTFRAFVEAWYDGSLQRIIFFEPASPEIRRMISSILAGYAWDNANPYVADPVRKLKVLEQLCRR